MSMSMPPTFAIAAYVAVWLLPGPLSSPCALGGSVDIGREYHNREVTALTEEAETVRLALGTAWDDALSCRAMADYLNPWRRDAPPAEEIVRAGARLYEVVKCIDDGISSVRLARDSRDEPRLSKDIRFWRNELAGAAREVLAYGERTAALTSRLRGQLLAEAEQRGLSSVFIDPPAWADPSREAWRRAGPATGVRLPLEPRTNSLAEWWNRHLSLEPGYIAAKLHSAGERFVTPETPVGAWGDNTDTQGRPDWARLNRVVALLRDRGCGLLLELPTLQPLKSAAQAETDRKQAEANGAYLLSDPVRCLPPPLAGDARAGLIARSPDGKLQLHGGAQLFDPPTARAYGDYLKAMAANLKREGLYDTVAAVHLELGDWAELPETVDYSDITRGRWQNFMRERWGDIGRLNAAAGTSFASFDELALPVRAPAPRAAADWEAFAQKVPDRHQPAAWGQYLSGKYRTIEALRATLGDDFKDGYGWRLPLVYPPVIGIDYLHFRRAWVSDYLAVKRGLAATAFPDKLIIEERRQFGDHDGVQGLGERKWGGFLDEDNAQWTAWGVDAAAKPFRIRSVGPVGFGTRLSDSIESLYRDYLWIHFCDPGNLARYFYHWVAHGYMDYQLGWQSVLNHWLTNKLVYDLGPTVAATAPRIQRLGMLLPRATYDLADGAVYYDYMGWDWVLQAAKRPYTRIDESVVRAGSLGQLPVEALILPRATALDDKLAAELAAWVQGGGLLICDGIPGLTDEYGRVRASSALEAVIGVKAGGTTTEAVRDTPLTVTIPHGHYSGAWQAATDRKPAFDVLSPVAPGIQTLAVYRTGGPAIALNAHGKGRAVTLGYPFGAEAVECERTSLGFQRAYVWFAREPQLVARTAWLRALLDGLGVRADYDVEFAEVGRFKGIEAIAPDLHMPKGFTQDSTNLLYIRTLGDPRQEHELEVERETPDLALRFFPRERDGLKTWYLGISTREVHYLGPRATVNMILARHSYRCRINDPKIQAIWDVARQVPVGFDRDEKGVSFTVALPSGHIMMLAVSDEPRVDLIRPAFCPGRDRKEVLAACRRLTGRWPTRAAAVTMLNDGAELAAWARELAAPIGPTNKPAKETILISYGQPDNQPAAEKLAAFLRERFGVESAVVEQSVKPPPAFDQPIGTDWQKPVILIGNEWSNNDLALHGAYWGIGYGAHLPFTATYAWPGSGRAVVSLSRRYALTTGGGIPFMAVPGLAVRPAQRAWPILRRKLFIAADGPAAVAAVDALIKEMSNP